MTSLLLLDNRDSFVWNLAQAFAALGGEVEVVRSDKIRPEQIGDDVDGLVLSPGPGRPEDAGICIEAVRRLSGVLPILGVCLGHQAIGVAFGAQIGRSPPCHGKAWPIQHTDDPDSLLHGLGSPFEACRYHSLSLAEGSLPSDLVPDAFTPEGVLMSMHHRTHSTFGVQFHPESFRSPRGRQILARFLECCA